MLQTLKKFFDFCGEDNRRMFIASIWLGVVSAICSAMRIPAAAIVIQALLERNVTMATLWTSLGIIVISLIITIAINMKATMLQTRAGYRACANKRIEIAEHLRYLPMGWFNDNSLGEVTSVTTNTMENMANVATRVVMVTTRGFLTSGIIAAMMFLFDWRMGLITLTGLVLFFAVNAAMQRAEQTLSQRKFNADERLVSKVLEYVQGIAEVKNFDLTHDSATQVHGAVEEARKASFAMEIPSVLYMLAQFVVNKLTGVAVCAAAIVFYFSGTMAPAITITTWDTDIDSKGDIAPKTDSITLPTISVTPVVDGVDTIAVKQAVGNEDEPIALHIKPSCSDGSETFNVKIDDIPDGAKITYGGTEYTVSGNSVTISGFDSTKPLPVTPPPDSNKDFKLKVTAQTVESRELTSVTPLAILVTTETNSAGWPKMYRLRK